MNTSPLFREVNTTVGVRNYEVLETARSVPVVAEADVVVCGGGPGGFPAAIAAARHGARTILIERYGFLGGMATAGLVAPIGGHRASRSQTPIVEGLLRELVERLHALGGCPTWEESLTHWGVRFDAEALKVVLDEMCLESGVQLMLHSYLADAVLDDGVIKAVLVENKSGRQAVVGRVFVDGTGDADIAFRAGAPTTHGRPFDRRTQPFGSFFYLAGYAPLSGERSRQLVEQIEAEALKGRFGFYNGAFLNLTACHSGQSAANITRFGGNADDAGDVTRAEVGLRAETWKLVRYLRENVPEFRDCYLQQSSFQAGLRESRQIVGPYVLTAADVLAGAKCDDAVARGSYWIDIHCPRGLTLPVHLCVVECPEGDRCPFWAAEHGLMPSLDNLRTPPGDWYHIPYRCLRSTGLPNLLATGRCISATHEAMASARIMAICMAIGQAAGTAAALAVADGVALADLDVRRLQLVLRKDGQLM